MPTPAEKRARFRQLHESGCFAIPNPWDAGSAKMLQAMGFQAVASTSSGMAWAQGRLDNEVPAAAALDHLTTLSAAVDIPLNADFENGLAEDLEGLARNVRAALDAGVAGLSIEDLSHAEGWPLHDEATAVERVKVARAAIDAEGSGGVLVARTEGLLKGTMDLKGALDRLVLLADAGADCLYVPGLKTPQDIAAAVKAVAPKPLNVLAMNHAISVTQYADLGVRRVSVGGALARAAWAGFLAAAKDIAEQGRFDRLAEAATGAQLKALLKP
jgi:2-methylisocitrate lyase-like PEP mutase family enzyme